MKNNGFFTDKLFVFDYTNPNISLTDNIDKQPRFIKLLLGSNFSKKEIDFFILYYGLSLSVNEIYLKYYEQFKSLKREYTVVCISFFGM